MKALFVILFVIPFYIFSPLKAQVVRDDEYVLVMGVELLLNTPANIPCERFASSFDSFLEIKQIYDKDSVSSFNAFISKTRPARKRNQLDVRRQFIFVRNDKQVVTVCSDGLDIEVDGSLVKRNRAFLLFLESMLPASIQRKDNMKI